MLEAPDHSFSPLENTLMLAVREVRTLVRFAVSTRTTEFSGEL